MTVSAGDVVADYENRPRMAGRSKLFRWMYEKHDELVVLLGDARPDWKVLAMTLGEHGLFDRTNHPPSAETARLTWWRVRCAVDKASVRPPVGGPPTGRPKRQTRVRVKASGTAPAVAPITTADQASVKNPFDDIARQLGRGREWLPSR